MADEKKAWSGVNLIFKLNNKDDAKDAPAVAEMAFFANKADAKVLFGADRVGEGERAPAKYVAFPKKIGFEIVQSKEYAATLEGNPKPVTIGKVYAHHYTNGEGRPGVLLSGGFNPAGIADIAKIADKPFKAIGSFTGAGAEPIAKAMADAGAALKAKKDAEKNAAADQQGGEAPALSEKPSAMAAIGF